MRYVRSLLLVAATGLVTVSIAQDSEPTDGQIRQLIVQASIRSYSGSCPCPYNTDRAGRRCGGRSAYSRPGGASPKCYASEVSDAQVRAYRERIQPATETDVKPDDEANE